MQLIIVNQTILLISSISKGSYIYLQDYCLLHLIQKQHFKQTDRSVYKKLMKGVTMNLMLQLESFKTGKSIYLVVIINILDFGNSYYNLEGVF